jgi:hypothetical protein
LGVFLLMLAQALASACVTGRETRPVQADAARGAPPPLDERAPAVVPPGQRWVAGYWRWDGVRYVWISGRLERESADYLR